MRSFNGHQYAVFLLHVAAGIEHALMVQYLFAAYSPGGTQVPPQYGKLVIGGYVNRISAAP